MKPLQPHRTKPKNVLITHVYSSDNKGDAALTSVLIDDIKRTFPNANLTILKLDHVRADSYFEGVQEKPSIMSHILNRYKNPLAKLFYAGYVTGSTLLWAKLNGRFYLPGNIRYIAELYRQADLIVPVGGGYIRSRAGLLNRMNIPLLLHPLSFGRMLGKPTVLYSQSVGPFQNRIEERFVASVFKRMNQVLIREDKSIKILENIGVKDNVVRAIDSGFLLKSRGKIDLRSEYNVPPDRLLIGVTVRSWLEGQAQINYEKSVAQALDNLIETQKAYIIFIPQVTASKGDDDRITSRQVYGYMKHKSQATVVEDAPDHFKIKAMYDNLDLLLGTRFHSVIFSLTSYVPVLAIEYEHKTSGIMKDLQLEPWVIKIEDATADKLIFLLQKLVEDQAKYKAHLKKYLPPYLEKAKKTANYLQIN